VPLYHREIISYYKPTRKEYALMMPWKQRAEKSSLSTLSQICKQTRRISLPLIWSVVYVETMKDWSLLWKRICPESGQHVQAFIQLWVLTNIPLLAMDDLDRCGKDLLWFAFMDRLANPLEHQRRRDRELDRITERNRLKEIALGKEPSRLVPWHLKPSSGPDGLGPDAIIESSEMFREACAYISSTWSKKLRTIYWDASTCFPEEIIVNIRKIQEEDTSGTNQMQFPGLENLWIDYRELHEGRSLERIRSDSIYSTCYDQVRRA
jgi:hypothetical protein